MNPPSGYRLTIVDLYELSSLLQRLVEEANLSLELLEAAFVGLQISIRESGDVTILDLQGRSTIDGGESELLGSRLKQLVTSGVRKLLLNLVNLTQVDSSGVGAIVAAYVFLKRQGGDLKLLCPCGRVLEVLAVFRLLGVRLKIDFLKLDHWPKASI